MPEAAFAKEKTLPPGAQLLSRLRAQFLSRLIRQTARLNLARLSLRPIPPTLCRTDDADHRVFAEALGEALKSGVAAVRPHRLVAAKWSWRSPDHIARSAGPGETVDMVMLILPGGRERTEPEYADLLDKSPPPV